MNNELITFPANAYKGNIGHGSVSYESNKFPAVDADYVLSTQSEPDPTFYGSEPVRKITYGSPLLPPSARDMYIYKVSRVAADAFAVAEAARAEAAKDAAIKAAAERANP